LPFAGRGSHGKSIYRRLLTASTKSYSRPCDRGDFVAAGVLDYHSAITATESKKQMTHACISTDRAVMIGKPCIKGTRITVELILRKLGAGRSLADLLEAYPQLKEDDLRAALAFAADCMQHETILAVE
jgi:uncharacterized protein (DUF433 family)